MIRDLKPEDNEFQLLVLYIYGRQALLDIEEGKQLPPENLVDKALQKARDKFQAAETEDDFEDIIHNMNDCRELLSTLKATYKNIGVDSKRVRAAEERLVAKAKIQRPSSLTLSGRPPEEHIEICRNGNQRLLTD